MSTSVADHRAGALDDFFETTPSGYLRVVPQAVEPHDDPELNSVIAYMRGRGWASAQHIAIALGYPPGESGKRVVRDIAARSRGEVIGGQDGYKLKREATPDERTHAANRLRSQARDMMARADEIEAVGV